VYPRLRSSAGIATRECCSDTLTRVQKMSPPSFSRDTRSRLGSSFRGPCVSWAVVWQTRPFAITANKEARRLLRPRFKTVFTGYLIIRLGADVTVNQHFAFRHHCGQHSYVLRFGTLEFNQIFFSRFCHCRSISAGSPHARDIDRASSDAIRVSPPVMLAHQIKASTSRPLTPRAAASPSTRSDRQAFPTAF